MYIISTYSLVTENKGSTLLILSSLKCNAPEVIPRTTAAKHIKQSSNTSRIYTQQVDQVTEYKKKNEVTCLLWGNRETILRKQTYAVTVVISFLTSFSKATVGFSMYDTATLFSTTHAKSCNKNKTCSWLCKHFAVSSLCWWVTKINSKILDSFSVMVFCDFRF